MQEMELFCYAVETLEKKLFIWNLTDFAAVPDVIPSTHGIVEIPFFFFCCKHNKINLLDGNFFNWIKKRVFFEWKSNKNANK